MAGSNGVKIALALGAGMALFAGIVMLVPQQEVPEPANVAAARETAAVGTAADGGVAAETEVAAPQGGEAVPAETGDADAEPVAADVPAADVPTDAPRVETLRVEPDGMTVIAGRAAAGATVAVMVAGEVLTEVVADASGAFVALVALPPSDAPRALSLVADPAGAAVASDETWLVAPTGAAEVEVAALSPEAAVAPGDGVDGHDAPAESGDGEVTAAIAADAEPAAEAAVDEASAAEPAAAGDAAAAGPDAGPDAGGDVEGGGVLGEDDGAQSLPVTADGGEAAVLDQVQSETGAADADGGEPVVTGVEPDGGGTAGEGSGDDVAPSGDGETGADGAVQARDGGVSSEGATPDAPSGDDAEALQDVADGDATAADPVAQADATGGDPAAGQTAAPETDTTEATVAEADAPEADVAEADAPEAEVQEAEAPETEVAVADAPETDVAVADAPEAEVAVADAPETEVQEAEARVPEVTVDVPDMTEPGPTEAAAPPVLVSDAQGVRVVQPALAPGAGPEVLATVAVDAIAYDADGGVDLSGRALGGETVRIYVDNAPLADIAVNEDGMWEADLTALAPGVYTLRVDQIGADGTVTSRVETPFLREERESVAAVLAEETAAEGFEVAVQTVQPGATLWAIARERYGDGILYVQVFEANRDRIRNPDLIYPGQLFMLPEGLGTP